MTMADNTCIYVHKGIWFIVVYPPKCLHDLLVQSIYDKKGVNLEQIATKIKPSFFYSEKALE